MASSCLPKMDWQQHFVKSNCVVQKKQAFGHLHKKSRGFGSYEQSCCFNAFWDAHLCISFCIAAVPDVRKKLQQTSFTASLTVDSKQMFKQYLP